MRTEHPAIFRADRSSRSYTYLLSLLIYAPRVPHRLPKAHSPLNFLRRSSASLSAATPEVLTLKQRLTRPPRMAVGGLSQELIYPLRSSRSNVAYRAPTEIEVSFMSSNL